MVRTYVVGRRPDVSRFGEGSTQGQHALRADMAAQRTAVTTVAIDRHHFIYESDRCLSAFRAGPLAFAAMDALFRDNDGRTSGPMHIQLLARCDAGDGCAGK